MGTITLPPPEEIRQRIAACERELRALRRLLRASQDAYDAQEARQARTDAGSVLAPDPAAQGGSSRVA
jgi:hypothetical protein